MSAFLCGFYTMFFVWQSDRKNWCLAVFAFAFALYFAIAWLGAK